MVKNEYLLIIHDVSEYKHKLKYKFYEYKKQLKIIMLKLGVDTYLQAIPNRIILFNYLVLIWKVFY